MYKSRLDDARLQPVQAESDDLDVRSLAFFAQDLDSVGPAPSGNAPGEIGIPNIETKRASYQFDIEINMV